MINLTVDQVLSGPPSELHCVEGGCPGTQSSRRCQALGVLLALQACCLYSPWSSLLAF